MRNACKCYNTDMCNQKLLKFLWTSNTKYGVMNIFWNLYEIGLWRSISAKIDLRKQTSQILMFQYPCQTPNDIPGTKVTSKRRAIVFEGFFGGPKNWTGDIGHSAITTPPTRYSKWARFDFTAGLLLQYPLGSAFGRGLGLCWP